MAAVETLVDWLRSCEQRIDLDDLIERLDDKSITAAGLSDYIHFADDRYSRNLLAYGPQFYALVMCWRPGQASPVHDHIGASCGVRVLQGVATETSFSWQDDRLVEASVSTMTAGQVCGSSDEDIHQIKNNGSDNLVTLHVYSPFLDNINLYDLESGEVTVFTDPMVKSLSA
ncbi:MAG: cysteine dioxygenase [Planctomycetota bacterium]|jgi:cysteine dioxygenase